MCKHRDHSPEFMAKGALEAIQDIAAEHAIHTIQVNQWKRELLDDASELFTKVMKSKYKE